MLLSNLKKWSRAIPAVSNVLTKGQANNLSKGFLNVAPIVNSFFLQQKSLNYTATENFGSLFKIKELKPCLPHKGKSGNNSAKRRIKRKAKKYVLPSHKGLIARIRVVITLLLNNQS